MRSALVKNKAVNSSSYRHDTIYNMESTLKRRNGISSTFDRAQHFLSPQNDGKIFSACSPCMQLTPRNEASRTLLSCVRMGSAPGIANSSRPTHHTMGRRTLPGRRNASVQRATSPAPTQRRAPARSSDIKRTGRARFQVGAILSKNIICQTGEHLRVRGH